MFLLAAVCLLAGCGDFQNRTYRYGDVIPAKPFSVQLVQTEYGLQNQQVVLKLTLQVANRSDKKQPFGKDKLVLRVDGGNCEIERDKSLLERIGLQLDSLSPGEEAKLTVPFVISKENAGRQLDLLVERREVKGKSSLSLVRVKNKGMPGVWPAPGEWIVVRSASWK